LQDTEDRLDELESLRRTRELTLKDLWEGGTYKATLNQGGQNSVVVSHSKRQPP
jgi:hypothetical protein